MMEKKLQIIISFLVYGVLAFAQSSPYVVGRSGMENGDYHSAIINLSKALENRPSDLDALYYRGLCYFNEKNYDAAKKDFLQLNRQRKAMGSLMLAKIEVRLNHTGLAINYLREHLSSSYKLPEKEILLDPDLMKLEKKEEWKALWQEREWYSSSDRDLQEAVYLASTGNTLDAINILNMLDKKGFKRSQVNQELAIIYSKTGNKKAALESIEKAVASDSRNTTALRYSIEYLAENDEYEKALESAKKLKRLAPDDFDAYFLIARVESRTGNYEDAVETMDTYLELFPANPEAYNQLGEIHFENKKFLNAISSFNKAIELYTGDPVYFFNRGRAYSETRTFKYANQDFSMSLDLDPGNAETWYYKGKVDAALGNKEDACYDFRMAFRYGKYEARDYLDSNCNE